MAKPVPPIASPMPPPTATDVGVGVHRTDAHPSAPSGSLYGGSEAARLAAASRIDVPATLIAPLVIEASGERTPDTMLSDVQAAVATAQLLQDRLSPPAVGPVAAPLVPPATPFGSRSTTDAAGRTIDPAFDRRSVIDRLVGHPVATVRQRAEEARAAIHHGAPDMGIKIRAAIDSARQAEAAR